MLRSRLRVRSCFDFFVFVLILSAVFILLLISHVTVNKRTITVIDREDRNNIILRYGIKPILYDASLTTVKHIFGQELKFPRKIKTITDFTYTQSKVNIVPEDVITKIKQFSNVAVNSYIRKLNYSNQQDKRHDIIRKGPTRFFVPNSSIQRQTDKGVYNVSNKFVRSSTSLGNTKDISKVLTRFQNLQTNLFQLTRGFNNKLKNKMTNFGMRKIKQAGKDFKNADTYNPERKDSCHACFKNDFQIILNQDKLCEKAANIDLVILISSGPSEIARRKAIRETWGTQCNHDNSSIKCIFVIGNIYNQLATNASKFIRRTIQTKIKRQLEKESSNHNDIVQFDFKDSYGNLTYKTLSGLRWAADFCSAAKYVMKTDTDMFINTYLLPFLVKQAPNTLFLGGFCWGRGRPIRDIASKWFVSYKRYPYDIYPPMCSGTGYILSSDVVHIILKKSENIPFFHLEDVYISLCLEYTSVKPRKLSGFSNLRGTSFEACNYKTKVITAHYMDEELMYQYWKQIESCKMRLPKNIYKEIYYTA